MATGVSQRRRAAAPDRSSPAPSAGGVRSGASAAQILASAAKLPRIPPADLTVEERLTWMDMSLVVGACVVNLSGQPDGVPQFEQPAELRAYIERRLADAMSHSRAIRAALDADALNRAAPAVPDNDLRGMAGLL